MINIGLEFGIIAISLYYIWWFFSRIKKKLFNDLLFYKIKLFFFKSIYLIDFIIELIIKSILYALLY